MTDFETICDMTGLEGVEAVEEMILYVPPCKTIITSYERTEYFDATGQYGSDTEIQQWFEEQVK